MKYRTLGQGLKVSALGIGCMPMVRGGNIIYGATASDDESIATIHRAIDLGITFFDTAEMYGPFANEELLGEAIRGKRDGLVIATKFALRWDGDQPVGIDGSPANARRACEGSLQAARHRHDRPLLPAPGRSQRRRSRRRSAAWPSWSRRARSATSASPKPAPETIRRAAAVHPIAALQSEYSLWEREVEDDILPVCRELGIGFVPYSPLGRGFLTGQIRSRADLPADDWRHNDPRYSEENFGANLKIVDAIRAVAERHGVSLAQIALAWLLAQGDDIVPIPGVKRRATLEDSAAAVDVELSAEDLAALDAARRARPRARATASAACGWSGSSPIMAVPLVLLPGALGSLEGSEAAASGLGARRPVVVIDYEAGDRFEPLLARILAAAGAPRFDLLGQSYGGWIAQCLAARHPERVRRLVLSHSFALEPGQSWRFRLGRRLLAGFPKALLKPLLLARVRGALAPVRARDPGLFDRQLAELRRQLELGGCSASCSAQQICLAESLEGPRQGSRPAAGLPVLIIESGNDPLLRRRATATLAGALSRRRRPLLRARRPRLGAGRARALHRARQRLPRRARSPTRSSRAGRRAATPKARGRR